MGQVKRKGYLILMSLMKVNHLLQLRLIINRNITKEKNLNPKFVLLPYAHQVKNNCAEEFLKPQNNILKIFNKLDVKLINYTQQFCAISNKNELFLPYDPVHLSEYGHKIVSDLLITDKIFIN